MTMLIGVEPLIFLRAYGDQVADALIEAFAISGKKMPMLCAKSRSTRLSPASSTSHNAPAKWGRYDYPLSYRNLLVQ